MADNDVTEFEEVDPVELHLVGTPANKFSALVAKSTEGKKKVKKSALLKQLKALEKQARQSYPSFSSPRTTGVNLGGRASTLSNRTNALSYVSAVLDHFENRVESARAAHETATNPMAKEKARREVQQAQRARLLAKMVIQENVRADASGNVRESRFGSSIFEEGSTYSLPDDTGLGYTGPQGTVR